MITRKIDYIHDGEVNKTELSQKGAEMRYEGNYVFNLASY